MCLRIHQVRPGIQRIRHRRQKTRPMDRKRCLSRLRNTWTRFKYPRILNWTDLLKVGRILFKLSNKDRYQIRNRLKIRLIYAKRLKM